MKQVILFFALIIMSLTIKAQNLYYIFPSDSSATVIALSQASGISNPDPRCALAGTPCLLKVNSGIAPAWLGQGYTASYLRDSLLTSPLWTEINVDSVSAEDQVARARAFGNELTLQFTATINERYQNGTYTMNQSLNIYNNYNLMLSMIKDGQLQLVSDAIGAGTIVPQGVVTQNQLNVVKAKLDAWLEDNPLSN